jgi:hypothetical protein
MQHKNDYSAIVFDEVGFLVKVTYVHKLDKLEKWLNTSRKFYTWKHINVYDRRTTKFIKQFKRGDTIPEFL